MWRRLKVNRSTVALSVLYGCECVLECVHPGWRALGVGPSKYASFCTSFVGPPRKLIELEHVKRGCCAHQGRPRALKGDPPRCC